MARILIIDDDTFVAETISALIFRLDHIATTAMTLDEGLKMAAGGNFDLILLDVNLPDGNGLESIPRLTSLPGQPEVIIITGFGDTNGASLAIENGAWDYLVKGDSLHNIRLSLERALRYRESRSLQSTTVALKREGLIGETPVMLQLYDFIARAAAGSADILLNGATGTGKEVAARAIHHNSARARKNFVVLDCTTLPANLSESILFGSRRGAFTGAHESRGGLIAEADGGTLFVDEIGDLNPELQKVLLRVLQEHTYRPLGETRERKSNFRLIAATNRNLEKMVAENHFRGDLYYRLKALQYRLPNLAERLDDIDLLLPHFINLCCREAGITVKGFNHDLLAALKLYDWPGNVRELSQTIAGAVTLAGDEATLFHQHLPSYLRILLTSQQFTTTPPAARPPALAPNAPLPPLNDFRRAGDREYLTRLLRESHHDLKTALTISGLSRSRLYDLLKLHQLSFETRDKPRFNLFAGFTLKRRSKMTIGKKIATGIGSVLFLMVIIAIWAIYGIGNIVENADEVIYGNKLRGEIAQKEVDHLNWGNQVTELLTDDTVTKLEVQTDPTLCAFGKWLLSDQRRQAEQRIPELAQVFSKIDEPHRKLHQSAAAISKVFHQADLSLPGFLVAKERDHLLWCEQIYAMMLNNQAAADVALITDPRLCAFGKFIYSDKARQLAASDPEMGRLLDEITPFHAEVHESAIAILKNWQVNHPGLNDTLRARLDDHRIWAEKVAAAIISQQKNLNVEVDCTRCALGRFLSSPAATSYAQSFPAFKGFILEIADPHQNLHRSAIAINDALRQGNFAKAGRIYSEQSMPALAQCEQCINKVIEAEAAISTSRELARQIFTDKTLPALEKTGELLNKMESRARAMVAGMAEANRIFASETRPALAQTRELLHQVSSLVTQNVMTDEAMLAAARKTRIAVIILSIIAALIGCVLAFFISNGIARALNRVITSLAEGAHQVAAAAGQVSSSSQSLAEGSSEQAASLEETSSSVEEMASMTKQNADNSDQADILSHEANEAVRNAARAMGRLNQATEEIFAASQETQKIVKSIDEIAFQTNLLALNAAVEAARAGEAGAGFAVVADEVRNLAARSADAARSTAELIGSTVDKVGASREIAAQSLSAIETVVEKSAKVGDLAGEISAASKEQANGISQINIAISEMDKVTQQNAANAEESAAAAEELNAQAEQMNEFVGDLTAMVSGRRDLTGKGPRPQAALSRPAKAPRPAAKTRKPVAAIQHRPEDDNLSDDFEGF